MTLAYGSVKKRPRFIGYGLITVCLLTLALFIIPVIIYGCAKTVMGPKHLYPKEAGAPGYSVTQGAGVFESNLIKITVRPLRPWENATGSALIEELLEKNYVILEMAIENRSREKILYNTAHASLMDNEMEYRKPMDYTDLYGVVRGREEGNSPESELRGLKGLYYDLTTTIPPGSTTSKLLIFPPLSERGKRARLRIKELYIGTDAISISFPFSMREAEVRQ